MWVFINVECVRICKYVRVLNHFEARKCPYMLFLIRVRAEINTHMCATTQLSPRQLPPPPLTPQPGVTAGVSERPPGERGAYLPSLFLGAGGLRVAQLVRMLREPIHCPFMLVMAVSASCGERERERSGQVMVISGRASRKEESKSCNAWHVIAIR